MPALNEVVDERPPAVVDQPVSPGAASPRRVDLWALLSYAALSLLVMVQLWRDPNGRVLSGNDDDHGIFLFMLAHGERVLFHGDNPFFTHQLNAPVGVNMMANTAMLALSLPVAPITHFLGGGVSVALLITLGLAGSAAAWYWVLSRHFVTSRVAAWIGGLWCGFAPTMVSHANGHVNFVSGYVVPFIVVQVLRLREPGRVWRGGITLALLVVLQTFINEESLLFTALTLTVFVLAYAIMEPRRAWSEARHFVPGMGVAIAVAGTLLAYPLWYQFAHAGTYQGQPFAPDKFVTDLASLGAFSRQALAGNAELTRKLSVSATEDNTFFGPFGLIMIIVAVVVLWRSVTARAVAIAAFVLLIASLGPRLRVAGYETDIPLPFALVSHVPVIDLVSVTRFAMVPAIVAGVLLALATDKVRDWPRKRQVAYRIGLVLALVPLAPKPLPIVGAAPLPPFLTQGIWRQYVPADRTLVPVPLPEVTAGRTGMRWAGLSNMEFAVPRGYFMGPNDPPADTTGSWMAPRRYTSSLVRRITLHGKQPRVTEAVREQIRGDLIFWRAAVVVLVPDSAHGDVLRATFTDALGPPRSVGGVEIWDVRWLPVPPNR